MYYSAEDKARVLSLVAKTYGARQRRFEQDNGPSPSQRSPNSIDALISLAESASRCRHVSICHYFGEPVTAQDAADVCGGYCDVCKNPAKVRKSRDEGLIELDFPATQAMLQGGGGRAEREDPFEDERGDDWEPDRTQAPRRGGRGPGGLGGIEEAGSGEEEEDDEPITPVPANPRREGFRSAAVQRDRDQTKAMQTLEEEPESSPLPELDGGDEPVIPTQEDSSDPADDGLLILDSVETAPVSALKDVKGSMVETPLDSEAELPPSAQPDKHIEPPSHVADDAEPESEPIVMDEVEAAAEADAVAGAAEEDEAELGAEAMELDGDGALGRKGLELAELVVGEPEVVEAVEVTQAVELSSDSEPEGEEPVAKRFKRLSHAPLFAPSEDEDEDEEDLPEVVEIGLAPVKNPPPPRDTRKDVGVPFKQMSTAHKAGVMKGCEWLPRCFNGWRVHVLTDDVVCRRRSATSRDRRTSQAPGSSNRTFGLVSAAHITSPSQRYAQVHALLSHHLQPGQADPARPPSCHRRIPLRPPQSRPHRPVQAAPPHPDQPHPRLPLFRSRGRGVGRALPGFRAVAGGAQEQPCGGGGGARGGVVLDDGDGGRVWGVGEGGEGGRGGAGEEDREGGRESGGGGGFRGEGGGGGGGKCVEGDQGGGGGGGEGGEGEVEGEEGERVGTRERAEAVGRGVGYRQVLGLEKVLLL